MPPLRYDDLDITDRNGRRVAVKDCRIEPLNLLIPGRAPILVPKRNAWRSPSQKEKDDAKANARSGSRRVRLQLVDFDDESDDENDTDDDENDDVDTKPLIKKKLKAGSRCRKDSVVKEKAREAKHMRRADRHQKRADREREEAEADREKMQRRIEKQDAYIAKLKARYKSGHKVAADAAAASAPAAEDKSAKKVTWKLQKTAKSKTKKKPTKKTAANKADTDTETETDTDGGSSTEGTTAVRDMLKNLRIRGGGSDEQPTFRLGPDDKPWTASEDATVWEMKKGGETWANIGTSVDRRKGEVQRRHKHLQTTGYAVPGADEVVPEEAETTEAEKTGEETTDAEATAPETTDAEATGAETTDAEAMDAETTDAEATGAETTDAEATGAETTDAEPEAAATDAPKAITIEWTPATDAQLWKLKEDDGKSWAEIHADMGGSKSDIKNRFKTLKTSGFQPPTAGGADDDDAAAAAAAPTDAAVADAVINTLDIFEAFAKKQHAAAAAFTSSPAAAADCGGGTAAYISTYARNLLAASAAGRANIPAADEVFDETDCLLLALAESRRHEHRWLEIQADFFNVTGRMVPVEILKWKLERGGRGEMPEAAKGAEDEEDDRLAAAMMLRHGLRKG